MPPSFAPPTHALPSWLSDFFCFPFRALTHQMFNLHSFCPSRDRLHEPKPHGVPTADYLAWPMLSHWVADYSIPGIRHLFLRLYCICLLWVDTLRLSFLALSVPPLAIYSPHTPATTPLSFSISLSLSFSYPYLKKRF